MNISVVMPTFNNFKRLEKTLNSFTKLHVPSYMSWELIVVDNNSNDLTKDIIKKYQNELPIKYVFEPQQGTSNAKNAGLSSAKGELIVCTDDDICPCENWLCIYWQEYFNNPKGFFWGGPVVSDFEVPPVDMHLISLGPPSVRGLDWGSKKRALESGEFFIGANWAVPASVLNEVGGYNPQLGLNPGLGKVLVGEENDLMDRLQMIGMTPMYLPDASVKHFVPRSKMTINHIADRAEATGRFSAEWVSKSSSVRFFGVPRWIWRKLITCRMKAMFMRLLRKSWYCEYVEYKKLLGCVKQIIDK